MSTTKESKNLQILEIPMFKSKIYYYKGKFSDFEKLLNIEGYSIDPHVGDAEGLCFDFDGVQAIWISSEASIPVKVHECLHAVLNICTNYGFNKEDDELLCYMLEYLIKSL